MQKNESESSPNPVWAQKYSQVFTTLVLCCLLLMLLAGLGPGLGDFETNFWNRKAFIAAVNTTRLRLGDRIFNGILVGPDGWLNFKEVANIDDYQNIYDTDRNAQIIHQKLIELNTRLAARGITVVFVFAPNKATIYPESLPGEIQKIRSQSRLDQVLSYFAPDELPLVVDTRQALTNQPEAVYYKTDSHWNVLGSYLAYQAVMQKLVANWPQLAPYPLDYFSLSTTVTGDLDLARLLGTTYFAEAETRVGWPSELTTRDATISMNDGDSIYLRWNWMPDQSLPRVVMYHDSFGYGLMPFFAPHFSQALYIWSSPLDLSWIEQANPDIVILEIAERNLLQWVYQ